MEEQMQIDAHHVIACESRVGFDYSTEQGRLQIQNISNQVYLAHKRKLVQLALISVKIIKRRKLDRQPTRIWVSPILKFREKSGFFYTILPLFRLQTQCYEEYFRMTATQLEELLQLVGPYLQKSDAIRRSIDPKQRLCMTLRYLATGETLDSIRFSYLVANSTASNIIGETCSYLWQVLQPLVLPGELTSSDWLRIAKEFEEMWQFPNCIGAIDGKHVLIECPDKAGSMYFNYKGTHSIVLLGMCDANLKFTFVDIGAYGRRSDGGIYRESDFGQKFDSNEMNVPQPRKINETRDPFPYVIVGDEAFPLKTFLMRPYPGKEAAEIKKRIFNYRLSRARRLIECCFGILCARFRVFRTPISFSILKINQIVKASIVLHNWLRQNDLDSCECRYVQSLLEDDEALNNLEREFHSLGRSGFDDIYRIGAMNANLSAIEVRNEFCDYFNLEGQVSWQWDRI